MTEHTVGDRVRVDIPDETDSDHGCLHARHGENTEIIEDDASTETGDLCDSAIYRVRLTKGEEVDVRWCDLRPPIEE